MVRRFRKFRQSALTGLAVAGLLALQVQLLQPTIAPANLEPNQSSVEANYAKLPLAFEPNQGQVDSSVDFLVHHGQAVTAFAGTNTTTSVGGKQVTMSLDGANSASFTGQDELPSKTNYFLGSDQSQWHSDIPNFQKLLATNVYPGIDLAYYGTNSTLEHDFIVNPGSDCHQIAFNFGGQDNLTQDADGNLVIKAGDDEPRLNAPTTYQLGDHEKHTIPSKFELDGDTVTVAVTGEYDHAKPLVIDPTLSLIYSTYLGGSSSEFGRGIKVDADGNTYVVGTTTSVNFPTSSPYQGSISGPSAAFITKLSPTGALLYSTYLGGSAGASAASVAIDLSFNMYVTGDTASTDFPTASPIQASKAGGSNDAFITKLNPTGSSLIYSTYLGGSTSGGSDAGLDIEVDNAGSAYVSGTTSSADFPLSNPFQATFGGNTDVFVARLNAAGSALTFSTYLGGNAADQNATLAIDGSGNAYVAGQTLSTNFPTASAYQAALAGTSDIFLTKLSGAGAVTYSTYYGGTGDEGGGIVGVDADSAGQAYVGSITSSTNLPTVSPIQAANAGSNDAFVAKFAASGSSLVYATYLGGTGAEAVFGVALDQSSALYIAGGTTSTDFPTISAYQAANAGGQDAFVTKINSAGSAFSYSTYLGGTAGTFNERVLRIAVGLNGNAYVTGGTPSTNFPTANALQSSSAGGGLDAFVAELTEHTVNLTARVDPTLTFTVGSTTCALGTLSATQTQQCTYALTAATNGTGGYGISYLPVTTLTSGANTITALTSPTASTLNTEQFGINLAANTAAGSHTASNFGAAPSGGSGVASANYTTANSFKLATGGETIATASAPSLTTTYTVSTIANITNTTEAGAYTTTFTYNIVSTY